MPDFKEIRNQLSDARSTAGTAQSTHFAVAETLKRVQREMAGLEQIAGNNNADYRLRKAALAGLQENLERILSTNQAVLESARLSEQGIRQQFLPLNDPREQLENLDDKTPILLFPLRMETRFKKITQQNGDVQDQLWVRIYPDECSVDTFEELLTESELRSARIFWQEWWKAGGQEAQQRGAWAGLVAAHGSGRAAWIVGKGDAKLQSETTVEGFSKTYQPLSPEPVKSNVNDLILVITVEGAPLFQLDEAAALKQYWKSVWQAKGNLEEESSAFSSFINAVGGENRAKFLFDLYKPYNLKDRPKSDSTEVKVEILQLPSKDTILTRSHAWSSAPRVSIMPERFVLLGYNGDTLTINEPGNAIPSPLIVGPDPNISRPEDGKPEDAFDALVHPEIRWMTDFEEAVRIGMGFKIDLTPAQARLGFDRLMVAGVQLGTNETEGTQALRSLLLRHQYSSKGFGLLPQGAATNNTETQNAAFSRADDPDLSFDLYFKPPPPPEDGLPDNPILLKRDGEWLSQWLGLPSETFDRTLYANGADQREARAMNTALWPVTMGYLMDSMMQEVFSDRDVELTRYFFTNYVSGRGPIPALRIGKQPYGILPAGNFRAMKWFEQRSMKGKQDALVYLKKLHTVLLGLTNEWQKMGERADWVAKKTIDDENPLDAHQMLLNIVGLHPNSVEFYQRYTPGRDFWWNNMYISGFHHYFSFTNRRFNTKSQREALQPETPDMAEGLDEDGMELLEAFGYKGEAKPDILDKIFMKWVNKLQGPIVDDRPLSETDPIRAYTNGTPSLNYIQWLINNSVNTETLRKQEGFKDNQIPTALLYVMLHQALLEGYFDAGLRAQFDFELSDAQSLRQAKIDLPFIQMQERNAFIAEAIPVRESKYEWLYTAAPVESYSSMFTFLGANLFTELPATRYLSAQIEALQFLANTPTARLERVFAEHIDTVSYRLDAWKTGFNHILLDEMREEKPEGIFLGAYGWLENVRSENKTLSQVPLPAELQQDFQKEGDAPLLKDNTNAGYILGPSLNHTVAAAILRNGYLSNASSANRQTLAVNLTSERVRKAMGLLEGIQNGQSLGALLGYHLERGLHDRYDEATNFSVDEVIYDLRLAFPLYGGQLAKSAEDEPQESVEANNVINGLDLANQIKSNAANQQYPFGKGDVLPNTLTATQITAINEEVDRMLDVHDAVADLVMAESVYQVTLGNYDRAAATLDAFSKAGFPPEPQVAQTPRTGVGLTHRVGLHLNSTATAPVGASPRATLEPAIDEWLQSRLPPLDKIGCQVYYVDPGGNNQPVFVSLKNIGLSAIDLLYAVNQSIFTPATDLRANTNTGSDTSSRRAFAELDDRIEYYIRKSLPSRIDKEIRIAYVEPVSAGNYSLFEIASLLKSLRAVLLSSRNLMPGDLSLPEEATDEMNAHVAFKTERINALDGVINTALPGMQVSFLNLAEPLRDLRDLEKQILELEKQISTLAEGSDQSIIQAQIDIKKNDIAALKITVQDGSDTLAQEMIGLLKQAGTYGFPDSGIGILYAERRRIIESLRKKATDYQTRWENKLIEFDAAIAQFEDPSAQDWQKIDILRKAERAVSAGFVPGSTVSEIEGPIRNKRVSFNSKLDELKTILNTLPTLPLAEYTKLIAFKSNAADFDLLVLDIAEQAHQLYTYAEDLLIRADLLSKHLDGTAPAPGQKPSFMFQLKEAYGKIASAAEGVEKTQAVITTGQMLFGEEFRMIPTYSVPSKISAMWQNARSGADSLLDFQKNILNNDFPVDDWLHGIARVHEKMWHWENITLLSLPFEKVEPVLEPFQLPVKPNDRWLAIQYRKDADDTFKTPMHDHLLYTPHYGTPVNTNELCGVLIDEWTEVIPQKEETIGLGFHYDRPNCEPPQTWLMVLPTQIKNAWGWNELTAAMMDTLDEAKRRSVEPSLIDDTALARFLPATMATVTDYPITLQMNYAVNNIKYTSLNNNG